MWHSRLGYGILTTRMFLYPSSRYECDRTPFVTVSVAVVSSVVWLLLWLASYPLEVFTRFGFSAAHPHLIGMVSALFIHPGLIYVLPNVIFLFVVGKQLEDCFGHILFGTLFMACGIGSTLLFYFVHRETAVPCIGAAGAVAGIVAAFWIIFPDEVFDVEFHLGWWHVTDFKAKTVVVVATWICWQLIVGLVNYRLPSGYILWSNIGGFALGSVVALLMKPTLLRWRKQRRAEPEAAVTTLRL